VFVCALHVVCLMFELCWYRSCHCRVWEQQMRTSSAGSAPPMYPTTTPQTTQTQHPPTGRGASEARTTGDGRQWPLCGRSASCCDRTRRGARVCDCVLGSPVAALCTLPCPCVLLLCMHVSVRLCDAFDSCCKPYTSHRGLPCIPVPTLSCSHPGMRLFVPSSQALAPLPH